MRLLPLIRAEREYIILSGIFLLAILLMFKPWIHGFDPMGNYSWLRSSIIDNNLDVANEFEQIGFKDEIIRTKTGYTVNPYNVGVAVLWTPFFLIVHIISLLLQALGFNVVADG